MQRSWWVLLLVVAAPCPVLAESHRFNGQTTVDDFTDTDRKCTIWIDGQSCVQGDYTNPGGTLTIDYINGQSNLVLKGKCKSVVIKKIDGQSFVDLSGLAIGDNGVTIEDINGQSRVKCWTTGIIDVTKADGQSVVFHKDTAKGVTGKLDGRSRFVKLK